MVAQGIKTMVHLIWKECHVNLFASFPKYEPELLQLEQCSIIIADIHLQEDNILDDLILLQIKKPNQKIILYTSSHPWELGLKQDEFPFWGYIQKNSEIQSLRTK